MCLLLQDLVQSCLHGVEHFSTNGNDSSGPFLTKLRRNGRKDFVDKGPARNQTFPFRGTHVSVGVPKVSDTWWPGAPIVSRLQEQCQQPAHRCTNRGAYCNTCNALRMRENEVRCLA